MQLRRLALAGAWSLATGAAVTLSWIGVHTVLAGTDYDAPRALPVSEVSPSHQAEPRSSSTHRPKPSPSSTSPSTEPGSSAGRGSGNSGDSGSRSPSGSDGSGASSAPGTGGPGGGQHPQPPSGGGSPSPGEVRGATVQGGRAVFEVRARDASLVSATPNAGWNMQIWKSERWIRVQFTNGESSSTVFCRWDGSPPRIETSEG